MNISAKTEYACIAVLELALNSDNPAPVRIKDIAEKHGIPSRFLVQILLQLKSANLVSSVRGASGGYKLVGKPEDLSLGKVMGVIEGRSTSITSNAGERTAVSQLLIQHWSRILKDQQDSLNSLDFQTLSESVQNEADPMYYI